jgi:hypothetical protein
MYNYTKLQFPILSGASAAYGTIFSKKLHGAHAKFNENRLKLMGDNRTYVAQRWTIMFYIISGDTFQSSSDLTLLAAPVLSVPLNMKAGTIRHVTI